MLICGCIKSRFLLVGWMRMAKLKLYSSLYPSKCFNRSWHVFHSRQKPTTPYLLTATVIVCKLIKKYLMLSVMRNVKRGTRIVCLRLVRIGYQNIHQVDHDSVLTQSSIAGLIVLASSSILKATPHKIFMFTHRLINDVLKTWHAPSCDAICSILISAFQPTFIWHQPYIHRSK